MGITYLEHCNGTHRIVVPAKDHTLVLGWIVYDYEARQEKLYALHPDGRAMESEWLNMPNPDFNKHNRKWYAITSLEIPMHAEYCGQYSPDMFD